MEKDTQTDEEKERGTEKERERERETETEREARDYAAGLRQSLVDRDFVSPRKKNFFPKYFLTKKVGAATFFRGIEFRPDKIRLKVGLVSVFVHLLLATRFPPTGPSASFQ